MRPAPERGGLKSGGDFFLACSPEREDPGNPVHRQIPKMIGVNDTTALKLVYDRMEIDIREVIDTRNATRDVSENRDRIV